MRTIVEEDQFLHELREISGDIRRGDEFTFGVKWQLSKNPVSGHRVDKNIWSVKTQNDDIQGRIIVFYTFDKTTVHLLSIISLPVIE